MKDSGSGILKLEGELNIQCALPFREALLRAFEHVEKLSLDMEGLESIDISCLQLLCSAHRTFIKSNKEMTITPHNMTTSLKEAITNAGYARKGGCLLNPDGKCLCFIGGSNE